MSTPPDLPRIKPQEQPSLLNFGLGTGAFWGGIIGSLGSLVAAFSVKGKSEIVRAVPIVGTVVGAVIGAFIGKAHQEKEQVEGREVKAPSSWNKGIISGWGVSSLLTAPVGYFLSKKTLSTIDHAPIKSLATSFTASLLITATWIGSMIIGSNMRKKEMERDYNQSIKELGKMKIEEGISYMRSVSPQQAQELEARLHAGKNHAETVSTSQDQEVAPQRH
jgi:hypothetical protein